MVHKKSEYMLQFHKMSKELRWQIYRDNVQFRNTRRVDNAADHYWSHQLTDIKCDCEDESSNEEDGPFIVPPAYKLKHKALQNTYNSHNFPSSREIAVQTPDWLQLQIRTRDSPTLQYTHSGVNTEPELNRQVSVEPNRPANPTPPPTTTTPATPPPQLAGGTGSCLLSEASFRDGDFINTASSGRLASQHTFRTSPPQQSLRTKTPQSPFASASVPASASKDVKIRPRSSHFHLSPTRTNRKLYHEGKKTHFVPYGWNDMQSEIGHKKTHNVCAPDDQVYSSALEALRLRRADIENQLAVEAERRRKLRGEKAPINHSSLWMSEYRDKFRPSSARPQTSSSLRPCVGHATHHRPVAHRCC